MKKQCLNRWTTGKPHEIMKGVGEPASLDTLGDVELGSLAEQEDVFSRRTGT